MGAKQRHLAAQGMVESVRPAPGTHLGGLTAFKAWLDTRARAFEPAAQLARLSGASVTLLHIVEDVPVTAHGAPGAPARSGARPRGVPSRP